MAVHDALVVVLEEMKASGEVSTIWLLLIIIIIRKTSKSFLKDNSNLFDISDSQRR